MLGRVRVLLEMIRFSHTLFALPFALSSAALAWKTKQAFGWLELAGILLCMVFARSAAMAFNRLADRHLDAANPRTAGRYLPAGKITPRAVWLFLAACAAGFVAATALFLCAYSYTKRFTALSHFWLGTSLLLAPLAAWVAIRGMHDLLTPTVLGLAVLFWVAGFDIFYACQDVEFDRQAKLRSAPAALGVAASLRVALVCHLLMLACLFGLYAASEQLGWVYLAGVVAVALLLVWEHSLVRPDDLSRVNQAFFQVNGVISIGLLVVVVLQLLVA
jgi:4-hydroxybenzoate polyprenyltransferase